MCRIFPNNVMHYEKRNRSSLKSQMSRYLAFYFSQEQLLQWVVERGVGSEQSVCMPIDLISSAIFGTWVVGCFLN